MDEIYFKTFLKSNYKNEINRKPKTHSYVPYLEYIVGLSKDKVCITTAIDKIKNISADFINCELKVLSKHNSNNHMLRIIPVIKQSNENEYYIQNINNVHSQIK